MKIEDIVRELEALVDEFDRQGATQQATRLDGILDDIQAQLEQEAASERDPMDDLISDTADDIIIRWDRPQ